MKEFKGKFTDTSYLKNPEGTWQEAKNILLTKQYNSPLNENGTKFSHLIEGEVCGIIETNSEIVYFSIVEGYAYTSLISIYNYTTKLVTQVLKGNFGFNRPIEGIYKYNYKGELIVVWCDGVFENIDNPSNTPKIAKITGIDLPLVNGVLSDTHIELINLFPNIHKGTIEAFTDEGQIVGIQAYVTFKYGKNHEETQFKIVNTSTSLQLLDTSSNTPKPRGLRVEFEDLDYETYDYIIIGVHIKGKDESKSYETKRIEINQANKTYYINSLSSMLSISNEELLVPSNRFTKIESMTLHEDTIMALNVNTDPIFKFQKYANLLKLEPRVAGWTRVPNQNPHIDFITTERFLVPNEAYAIKIQLDLINGDSTEWFNIPNLDFDNIENENIWDYPIETDKYVLDKNRYDPTEFLPRYKIINTGDEASFGYYKDDNKFPDHEEYNSYLDYDGSILGGQDLRGKNITYHRIMEDSIENTEKEIIDSQAVVGAMIMNFNGIPIEVRKQIKGVRLGFTKRNFGNSLIIAEGLICPVAPQTADVIEADVADISQLSSTPFYPGRFGATNYDNKCFDRFVFFNPEIEDIKPKLNFNTLILKRFVFADNRLISTYNDSTQDIINPLQLIFDRNKFYNGYYNYDYKNPNNASQGSEFTDGGLYINASNNLDSENLQENAYLPNTKASAGNIARVKNIQFKTLTDVDVNMNCTASAVISLVDMKNVLYSLTDNNIVASNNTILLNDNFELVDDGLFTKRFKLGDVSYGVIHGSLSCTYEREVDSDAIIGLQYYNKHVKAKIITSYSAGILKIEDTLTKPNWSLYTKRADEALLLTSKEYGYSVGGGIASASLNDAATYPALDTFKEYLDKFPYRVIRSSTTPNESFIINSLRDFKIENYHELKNSKGDGVAIRAHSGGVYIQMRFTLLFAKVKDVLRTKDQTVFLESRDIFEIEPTSITPKPEGYIGSEHKFACKVIKEGYVTIDHIQGNIILATPEVKVLSMQGLRNELREKLEFDNTYREDVNGISKAIDNPYKFIGFSIGIDEAHNRLFISKLYPNTTNGETENVIEYYEELVNKIPPSSSSSIVIDALNSFTLSFSLDFNYWVCYHDFITCMFIGFKRTLYALKNVPYGSQMPNTGTIHVINQGKKGVYFGLKEESYIDLIFNKKGNLSKSLYSIELITESFIKRHDNLKATNKTISKIFVFSDNQASEVLELDLTNKDIIRYVEGSYRINNIRDIIEDRNLPILNERGEIIEANLNYSKNWFDKSYFIGKFIVIRLIWSNDVQDDIYINEVNVASQISQR